jgi:UDP-N-acetylglucosamine 1-carboxyvinyltransferase
MVIPALAQEFDDFKLPYAGGCDLGTRTVEPHLHAFRNYGLTIFAHDGFYSCHVEHSAQEDVAFTMTERGDTATENALLIAATNTRTTTIRNASSNYMVQDLCIFLRELGVQIDGIGSTTLKIRGVARIERDIEYAPSEDPIEAMSLLAAAIVTNSELTITRAPIEFLEIELATLFEMGLKYTLSPEYTSANLFTRLVDITVYPSKLRAAVDKIHPMPFPGLNIDNLPFFAVIAAHAEGQTLIHDWVFDNRAIHLLELTKLGATVQLLDPHRLIVQGPTRWRGRDTTCPPALRPAMCLMLAALAAQGESILRDVYMINRGYEDLPRRLNALGADVEVFYD